MIRRVLFVIPGVAALDHFPIDIPVPIGDHTDNPTVAVAVFHGNGDRFAPDQLDQLEHRLFSAGLVEFWSVDPPEADLEPGAVFRVDGDRVAVVDPNRPAQQSFRVRLRDYYYKK